MTTTKPSERGAQVQDTAGRALDLMVEIALEKGLDALSMRDVAKRASISLAALQYHFPSKDALVAAFVDTKLDAYGKDIAAILKTSPPGSALRNLVLYAIDQTLDARTDGVFRMLEARSRHDAATARALDGFMREYLEAMTGVIRLRREDLPPAAALVAAARIVAMIEGFSSVHAAAVALGANEQDLRESIADAAEAAIHARGGQKPDEARPHRTKERHEIEVR